MELAYDNFVVSDEAGLQIWREKQRIYSISQLTEYARDMEQRGIVYSNLFFF